MTGLELTVPGLTGLTMLARGGYATVYRAIQESIGREVAVKVENRRLESERDKRRFLREARAAGRMSGHPNVVDLFDAGVRPDGHPYLIMELCDGSYAERSQAAPLDPSETRDVGVKIADALADSHALGVLHRDVKPENILVTQFGEPVLADFGLAILAEVRDVSITFDVLTPAYAPPEFFWHARPGASGDVYSLCATLYTLMRGRPPRWSDDRNPSLVSIVDMFAEWVPDLPGVPQEFTSLLRSGMSNDPSARPSAIELRDALLGLRLATYISPAPRRRDLMLTSSQSALGEADAEPTIENPTQSISESDLLLADPRADPPAAAADPASDQAPIPDEPGRDEPGRAGIDRVGVDDADRESSGGAEGGFAPPRQRDMTTEAKRRRRWWTFVGSITGR